jgi:hypothetical protein
LVVAVEMDQVAVAACEEDHLANSVEVEAPLRTMAAAIVVAPNIPDRLPSLLLDVEESYLHYGEEGGEDLLCSHNLGPFLEEAEAVHSDDTFPLAALLDLVLRSNHYCHHRAAVAVAVATYSRLHIVEEVEVGEALPRMVAADNVPDSNTEGADDNRQLAVVEHSLLPRSLVFFLEEKTWFRLLFHLTA